MSEVQEFPIFIKNVDTMRVVAEIPHVEFKITVYSWNGKYLLKLEKGMYEQTYKISEMDVASDEDVKSIIKDEAFIAAAKERFKEMNKSLNQALNNL